MDIKAIVLFTKNGYILQYHKNEELEPLMLHNVTKLIFQMLVMQETTNLSTTIAQYQIIASTLSHIGTIIIYQGQISLKQLSFAITHLYLINTIVIRVSGDQVYNILPIIQEEQEQKEKKVTPQLNNIYSNVLEDQEGYHTIIRRWNFPNKLKYFCELCKLFQTIQNETNPESLNILEKMELVRISSTGELAVSMFGVSLKDLNNEFLTQINTSTTTTLSYKSLKYRQLSTQIPVKGGFVYSNEKDPLLQRFIEETVKIKCYEEFYNKLIQPKRLKPVQ